MGHYLQLQHWTKSAARTAGRISLLLLFLSVATGCSSLVYRATPEAKRTVVLVCNDYLTNVVRGDLNKLNQMVAWPEYLEEGGGRFTKRDFAQQVRSLKKRWSNDAHPLLGLQVTDISVGEFRAEVDLVKNGDPQKERIKVKLLWDGSAWVIVGDNLFGIDKRFSKLPPVA